MKENSDIDFETIQQIKRGDTAAFRLLVEKYQDVSFSLACSIVHNETDAEDALQEAFVKVYKGLPKFRFNSSFSTWLYRIVVNCCKTKYRNYENKQMVMSVDDYEKCDVIDEGRAYGEMELSEQKKMIDQILMVLKPDESLLLRLYYLAEKNVKEIKEITGFKESKIKVTLLRGRNSFKAAFEKSFGSETALDINGFIDFGS